MGITSAIMVPHPPLIIPEIGRGKENGIEKTIHAYHEAARQLAEHKPETIVLISPHQILYSDYFHISPGNGAKGDFGSFMAGQVKMEVSYDTEFVKELCTLADDRDIPAGTLGERDKSLDHGTMVPLYFVNQYWKDYKLVRIGLSGMPLVMHYELGQCIKMAADKLGRNTAIIASGDLSHKLMEDGPYGYSKEGPEYDNRVMDVMERAAFHELLEFSENFMERAAECGHRSFVIMAGTLDERAVEVKRLSYEGPFGVGYGICTYEPKGQDSGRSFKQQFESRLQARLAKQRKNEDAYVSLARRTIEEYVTTGKMPDVPNELPEEMREKQAGVFVSIKKDGRLRGCIGTIEATQSSIAKEIVANAISAATRDPRFSPIKQAELPWLTISVDVLGDTEKIASTKELDVKRYGVIVTRGRRRGLLLPNLEGVDTVEEQLAIARQKAGIDEEEPVELERFEVVRHY
ncbi:MAG: AmmeMemoRadiSam system protein A [Clostridium sp.]|nr:AmmeMemoRadiSam system protein A [Clostridium sp.]MCM1459157.1 AmmeMemoRadiSam system protein A [Bacteroides sp.]